mgnify:CR=1 FL=1
MLHIIRYGLDFLENDIQQFESFSFVISLLFKTARKEDKKHLMSMINKIIPVSISLGNFRKS